VVAVAFELEHAVDEVLEHSWPGNGSVLRHMTDEDDRDALLLGHAQKPPGCLAHLADRPGRGTHVLRIQRLDRVDHADVGPLALQGRADRVELRLGEDLHAVGAAEPRRAQLHLRGRLLTGDEQRAPAGGSNGAERRQEECRLADTRLAADEHERSRHEPATQDPIELGDAGRDPVGLLCNDIDEPEQWLRRDLHRCRSRLLDKGAERVAAGALAEPTAGGVAALGARELNCRLGHRSRLAAAADEEVTDVRQNQDGWQTSASSCGSAAISRPACSSRSEPASAARPARS
jgi:hypothetical protein